MVSTIGLKLIRPAMVRAVTISGDATNENVFGFPSFRFAKFLLNEVIIEFFSSGFSFSRFHCPIHGPHALASTTPPIARKSSRIPSR